MPPASHAESRSLQRAVIASLVLHLLAGLIGRCTTGSRDRQDGSRSLVDIELAPPPPVAEHLPEEVIRPNQPDKIAQVEDNRIPEPPDEAGAGGVDAAIDARPKHHPDAEAQVAIADAAMPDAAMVATGDAASTEVAVSGGDAGTQVAVATGGSGSGDSTGSGSGSAGAVLTGAEPTEGGEPGAGTGGAVSPGTAANLLAYFPSGHVVTAMIRFDRIRGTTWQAPIEKLFHPMPDHVMLLGDRDLAIGDLFDTLVISTPSPRDAIATTLVVKHHVPRAELRDVLDEPETPVVWSATKGGMYGARRAGARVARGDRRQFLAPYLGWIVLAQPRDITGLTAASAGDLDTVVATTALPAWLDQIRSIEDESGTPDGPALVVTMAATQPRYDVPDVGLDIASVPGPERLTIALEIAKQGFIVRGNLRFKTEADAIEMVDAVTRARQRVLDSTILRGLLNRSRALNAVKGLTLDRRGMRVSYATSISVADAEGLLAVAGAYLEAWFREAAERGDATPAPAPKTK